ncbi:IscS subfamily cysteine desulfurase [Aliifodinibius sp. S!AR15-10]|uniref:IscS subfamily cysteine desulfurase n=1 Tax=Aliifodinibius sp. S!AR15-10 TaxID=2950437 RepID=UPI00285F1074|nr:IscS subfamily cysteine desulfurase [Aliifodinibius sp. S!AR15-10]MDR8393674.1 IscS subfamily cysteine desulfurase [Aliifodinibius sp. S!AR15-10]
MIYLDYAATTPMSDHALEVYGEVARKHFGNASSLHDYGSTAQQILEQARQTIGNIINAESRGIYFTAGGSDANELVIQSLVKGNSSGSGHLLTTRGEHSSVRNVFTMLKEQGYEVEYIPVDQKGRVKLDALENMIRGDTILASVHHGNSEIGTIQDLRTIGELLNKHEILFHSDCVQTFGKIPVDVKKAGLDAISISAHKIYGPKGVGAAYINPSLSWKSVIPGTTQEKGFASGTVNVPGVGAFMAAANDIVKIREEELQRERELRNQFIKLMADSEFDVAIEGDSEGLPNIIGLRVHGMEGQYAMIECNRHGLAISTGSACSVGSEKPASSMVALGRDEQEVREFIRVSLGKETTKQEIQEAVKILKKVLTKHFSMIKL